ncbi:MAG: hypothetical protein K1Y02_05425 [Candidatus Hydrogenedentes bacterium]|nr:hypothetical protein [Candidatus Hydrogenedentota bacterium]
MAWILVAASLLVADADFSARVDTVRQYVATLDSIAVPADLQAQRDAKVGELKALLEKGAKTEEEFNQLYLKFDEVLLWLWKNASDGPTKAPGTYTESADSWTVDNGALVLTVSRADLGMTVKTPATQWRFLPCDAKDLQVNGTTLSLNAAASKTMAEFRTGYSLGMLLTLAEFPDVPGLELRLTFNLIGNEIVFELTAVENGINVGSIRWPKAIETGNTPNDFAVIPHMQGMLLPGDWKQDIHQGDLVNSRSLYMPWWGQIRDGHGVQTILETSDDAGAFYNHPSGGPTTVEPQWYASLGKVAYLRTIRYVFDDAATYVTMAKRYRRYAIETGNFVSLNEKRTRTPNVNEVIGRPVIHIGSLYHFVPQASLFNKGKYEQNHQYQSFDALAKGLKELHDRGVTDAYVHLDGWGCYGYDSGHPDTTPVGALQGGPEGLKRFANTCDTIGYLFAVHDQYRDFYFNAASFDDRLAAYRVDGSREEGSTWPGGPQTILSARFAPEYVRHNHDYFVDHGIKVKGAYLDVFSVVPLEESSEKAHPMTRSECARYRRMCFDLLRARGYVVSSEEPTDYLAKSLDLVHHGPYATFPGIGGGGPSGIPIPLWNLVYHDSVLLPWDMGEDGGWGIPKGDAGRLHCLLNTGLPYLGLGATDEEIARMKEACELNTKCATLEMTNHEFLDASYRKQRTTFADGTSVTVDFDAKTYSIEYPNK